MGIDTPVTRGGPHNEPYGIYRPTELDELS